MFNGIAGSPGIGIGTAVLVREPDLSYSHVVCAGVDAEQARLSAAVSAFIEKTRAMAEKMEAEVGAHQAEILLGQVMMIEDPFMMEQMNDLISQGQCAEAALDTVCGMYYEMFAAMDDELMRQRATDIQDMRTRLLMELLGQEAVDLSALPATAVVVAHDLTPSMTAGLKKGSIAGILTEVGGTTSHSAILARTMELPAVLSVDGVMESVKNGDTLIIDGSEGVAIVNPDADTLANYQQKQAAYLDARAALGQYAGKPTVTADGRQVLLYGNIGNPSEAELVMEATGEGIGLFRTEFLFMDRDQLPTEEEQYEAYKQALETMKGREVIIRTLDVGGDKDIPYLGLEREENPFLGFRAVRYCLAREDVYIPQLRALVRASAYGDLKIMVPLVTCVEELRRVKTLIADIQTELDQAGIPYNKELKVGVMIETPAAALVADLLAKEADFFSIGTNDLTQYVMAADRGNKHVAGLGVPWNPAVLRAIRQVIRAGQVAGIPVGMCGEAAADAKMIPLLLSFGLDEFSVSPSALLSARKAIASWKDEEANALCDAVMALTTAEEVLEHLKQKTAQ